MATTKNNKVNFGLKNVHYALITVGEGGAFEYGKPKKIPNAVNLKLKAEGSAPVKKYADDVIVYTVPESNNGYSGTITFTNITDEFMIDVLGYEKDENGNLFENVNAKPKSFALLYEGDGDATHVRRVFYNCLAGRPNIENTTKGEKVDLNDVELDFNAMPNDKGIVLGIVKQDSADYESFYTNVVVKK